MFGRGRRPELLREGTLVAEPKAVYTLGDYTSSECYGGFIDLTDLSPGDSVEINLFTRVRDGKAKRETHITLSGPQEDPIVRFDAVYCHYGWVATFSQTTGMGRSFYYQVYKE